MKRSSAPAHALTGTTARAFARWLVLLGCSSLFTMSAAVFAQKTPLAPPPPLNPPPPFPTAFLPPGLFPSGVPLPPGIPRWTPTPTPPATIAPVSSQRPPRTVQAHLLRPEQSLLESPNREDHLRAVQRAAASDAPESTALLLELWTGRSPVLRDAEVMSAFTKGLAKRRGEPRVRDALVAILGSWGTTGHSQAAQARYVRHTAAVALAQDGSEESLRALFMAVERESMDEAASSALLRFPPRKRPAVMPPLTPKLLAFLEQLGDLRFADAILGATSSPKPDERAAAFHAAALVPDTRVADIARRALAEQSPNVRCEATYALVKLHAKDAEVLVTNLLKDEATAARGAQMADLAPTDAMARGLREALAKHKDPEVRFAVLQTLSRMRSPAALDAIVSAIAVPELRTAAVRAIAFSEAPEAPSRIERLSQTGGPAEVRAAIQAYALRLLVRGSSEQRGVLTDLVSSLSTKEGHEAQATAWFILALLERGPRSERDVATFLARTPALARRAYASALSVTPDPPRELMRGWLARERDDKTLRVLVAATLSHPEVASVISRKDIYVRATSMGVEAPLAARVWVSDATEENDEADEVTEWLHAPSANLRVATALGLRSGKVRSAVGLLVSAYNAEGDSNVRSAILSSLTALIQRRDRTSLDIGVRNLVSDIALYDPDPRARQSADDLLAWTRGTARPTQPAAAANTFATLVSIDHNASMPLALYVSPGGTFRVVPFLQGEAIVPGISERPGNLNLAIELP